MSLYSKLCILQDLHQFKIKIQFYSCYVEIISQKHNFISTYPYLEISKKKVKIIFILYRNCVLEILFQFTYEFGHQISTFKTKIFNHPPLRHKYNLIYVIYKSCPKNKISVLHISLDISKEKNLNSIHFIPNCVLETLFQLDPWRKERVVSLPKPTSTIATRSYSCSLGIDTTSITHAQDHLKVLWDLRQLL